MPEDRLTISSSARLHPDDVARHTFGTMRRGFDPVEVRTFLEYVAGEMEAAAEREAELRASIAAAEQRAANPVLDDATLTAALGQETARVLRSAHDAAAELVTKAEADATRLRTQAQEEADHLRAHTEQTAAERSAHAGAAATELRRRAEEEATARLEGAKVEAEQLVTQAREECRAMVQEAQELRTRVLADLARRRRVLHSQIEQLRAGRERLAETIGGVREAVDHIADDLFRAEDEARLAAEVAGRQAAKEEPPELPATPATTTGAAADRGHRGASEPGGEQPPGEHSVEELFARLRAETTVLGPSDAPSPEEVPAPPPSPSSRRPPSPAEADTPPTGTPVTAAADGPRRGDTGPSPSGAPSSAPGGAVQRTAASPTARSSPSPEAATGPVPSPPPTASGSTAPPVAPSGVAARPGQTEPGPAAGGGGAPATPPAPAVAVSPRSENPPTAGPARTTPSTGRSGSATGSGPDSLDGEEAADVAAVVDPAILRRDEVLAPLVATLARRLKRALQDDQNDILDRLRAKGGWAPGVLLPEDEHARRYTGASLDQLTEVARAGATSAGGKPDEAPGVTDVAGELAGEIVAPLRRRLDGDGRSIDVGDDAALVELVGAAFREWKGSRIERLAGDKAVLAFARAALAAVPGGTRLRWVVDDEGAECPDCDDNALAGPVSAGEEFPTGHRHPPAHAGCRCLLAPPNA